MRLIVLLLLTAFSPLSYGESTLCMSIFSTENARFYNYLADGKIETTADKVYGSQDGIGHVYALYKTFKDAKIDVTKTISDLTKKERQNLIDSLLHEVKNLPAVISPTGRIFIVDGHHDFFVLSKVVSDLSKVSIKLKIVADYSQTGITQTQFKAELVNNGWIYGNVDKIVDQPLKVQDMPNHVERSQMGLALLTIAETYDVPLKGKYFSPYLQFRLVDFLKSLGVYKFSGTDKNTIDALVKLILSHKDAITFLLTNLKADAPKELRDFLLSHLETTI